LYKDVLRYGSNDETLGEKPSIAIVEINKA
jgi:hypothetical protein